MKKTVLMVVASILSAVLALSALAEEAVSRPGQSVQSTQIKTTIDPTFTVVIPAVTTVSLNTQSTAFGELKLSAARLEPGYAVKIELEQAQGTLRNELDDIKTIAYTIQSGNTPFTSATYTDTTGRTPLAINISNAAWDAAYAGNYSGTVNFKISYVQS